MKIMQILTRRYGVTPTIVLCQDINQARHVSLQHYGVTIRKVYTVTVLLWKDDSSEPALRLWFSWISFDYRVPLAFGSIAGGLDHVNHAIRLSIEHGISRAPTVVKSEIRGNVTFEIESQFMRELREDTFSEKKNEDAYDHVDRVLNVVSLFNIHGVSQDAVLLRMFPFTLTGAAKRWVDRLSPGAVNTWDLLKNAFIQRYCSPSKTAKRLEDIYKFKTSSRNISNNSNTDGLDVIVSELDNLGHNMKKLKENIHAIQVGCKICEGPHLDKECPLGNECCTKGQKRSKMDKTSHGNGMKSRAQMYSSKAVND
nr:hypothetical protein [Tanacetum cinerariifolium]